MEKILNFSFKFGKIFSVFLLLLCLFLFIIAGFNTLMSCKSIKLEIPTFTEISRDARAAQSDNTTAENDEVAPYILTINEIVKICDLNKYGKEIISMNVYSVNDELRNDYANGLKRFLVEYYEFAKIKKMETSGDTLMSILKDYQNYFLRNVNKRDVLIEKQKYSKIINISLLSISIIFFMLCLIIPLLIKIEENTRNNV